MLASTDEPDRNSLELERVRQGMQLCPRNKSLQIREDNRVFKPTRPDRAMMRLWPGPCALSPLQQ